MAGNAVLTCAPGRWPRRAILIECTGTVALGRLILR
jgi:hypothetical protein